MALEYSINKDTKINVALFNLLTTNKLLENRTQSGLVRLAKLSGIE